MQLKPLVARVRVCNSHMVSIPAIWIGWCRQSAVNMLSYEKAAVKRQTFARVHIANCTLAPRMASH